MTDHETPSWATPAPAPGRERDRETRPTDRPVPRTLVAGTALAVAVAIAEIVHVLGRDDLVPALRGFLVLIVGSQVGLAWGVLRRSSGAVLGLVLCELTASIAAATGGLADGAARPVLATAAAGVIVLVSMSMRAFPSPQLPPLAPRPFE